MQEKEEAPQICIQKQPSFTTKINLKLIVVLHSQRNIINQPNFPQLNRCKQPRILGVKRINI